VVWYIDTSALIKLVTVEAESRAIHAWIADVRPVLVSSDLLRTELRRAAGRAGTALEVDVAGGLGAIDLLPATPSIFEAAGAITPTTLRSLDTIHLATALDLGSSCVGMITYDDRLGDATRTHGLAVIHPS
jgi:uncharacterized protein